MPEIADVLERESRTIDLEPGDFDRLLGRRERKQRKRRLRAGAVGLIVALVAGFGLVRSLTAVPVPADPPDVPRPAPAASGSLAYALDGDIFVADPNGSNAVRIADGRSAQDCYGWGGEYWAEGPMWSPNGRYLAFRRYTDCGSDQSPIPRDVVISDARGNVLATFAAQGWGVAWSPDSTRVAAWDVFGGTDSTIGVYGLDGDRQAQLAMPPGWEPSGDHDPVWMPGRASLMVDEVEIPLDGTTPTPLPSDGRVQISYSPDGSYVAYRNHGSLFVARPDGSEPREIFASDNRAYDFTWSPAGDRIAYTGPGLRVVDVATGSVTRLGDDKHASITIIGFSPQGDRLLFSRTEDRGPVEGSLWSVGVDGSDARLVVEGTVWGDWLSR